MSALSDHQQRQRKLRIAQARERVSIARRYLATRPQATGSDVLRNLVDAAVGLIEELSLETPKA